MTRSKALILFGIALSAVAFLAVRYMNEFSRIKRVEIGNAPVQPGTIGRIVFTNTLPSKVEFLLECHFKVKAGGRPLLSEVVSLPPSASVEFDVNPELAHRELPRIIANKGCEAIWRGPFGIRRSAWWLSWEYARPAYKAEFE